jgi:excisionase family DNA binding protein
MFIDNSEDLVTMAAKDYQNPKILTVQEVADILRVHRSTISRYAMSGELRSYVIGNRRLFKETEVWAFFENRIAPESKVDQRCVFGKEEIHGNCDHPKTLP